MYCIAGLGGTGLAFVFLCTFLLHAGRGNLFDDGQQIVVDKKDGVGVREEGLAWEDAAQSDGTVVQCRNIKSSINLNLLIITGAIFSHTWIDHDRTSLMDDCRHTFPTLGVCPLFRDAHHCDCYLIDL
jgi:hypothetical protein